MKRASLPLHSARSVYSLETFELVNVLVLDRYDLVFATDR
jgi:hypothetical protein